MAGEINFGLLGPGIDFSGAAESYVAGLQATTNRKMQQAQLDQQTRSNARQDAQTAARQTASGQAAAGNYGAARTTALSAGDFDLVSAIGKMDDDQKKTMAGHADLIANTAMSLKAIPDPVARRAAFDAARPSLAARGLGQDELDKAATDLSDAALDGHISSSMTVKDAVAKADSDRKFGLETNKFSYQQKHDGDVLGVQVRGQDLSHGDAAANRDVTMRGQNMTAASRAADNQGAADPLDRTSITYVADQYRKTGQMPPLGMGKQAAAMRAAIIGEAARRDAAEGTTGADAAVNHADYHANRSALATISRTNSNILAFEDTANRNADYVLSTAKKGAGTTGVPLFNAWQQAGRRSIGGNPDVSRFDVAIKTFASEYAKVTSGASGGAVTSDSARHEIDSMINGAQTQAQLEAVIGQAKADMRNRREALNDQRQALRTQLRGRSPNGTNTPPPPSSTSAAITHVAVNGSGRKVGWNGSAWVPVK